MTVPAGLVGRSSVAGLVRRVRRFVSWHRGLIAGALAAAAVACTIAAVSPSPPRTERVLAATRDLSAGAALGATDLQAVPLPPAAVPAGALRPGAAVTGRLLAGPVRRGEPLTDVRFVGPGLLAALGGSGPPLVAVPVRIADAGSVTLLRPTDVVDVLAAAGRSVDGPSAASGAATVVARGVPVLTVPDGGHDSGSDGALIVVATNPDVAARLAAAGAGARLSVTIGAR